MWVLLVDWLLWLMNIISGVVLCVRLSVGSMWVVSVVWLLVDRLSSMGWYMG